MTSSDEELRKTVYAHAGAALYSAQVFEESLTCFLCAYCLKNRDFSEKDKFLLYEESLRAKTLGALIKDTKKRVYFSPEAEQMINDALKDRNYLSHHFFKDYGAHWHFADGCNKMISILQGYQQTFNLAEALIGKIGLHIFRSLGFTEEAQEEIMIQMKKEAEQDAAANP